MLSEVVPSSTDAAVSRSLYFLREVVDDYHPRDFSVRFWDGTSWEAETESPRFTLVLKHPGAVRRMFWPPNELSLSETYIHDDIDIEGDLDAVFALADHWIDHPWSLRKRLRLGGRLLALPRDKRSRAGVGPPRLRGRRHSRERDRQAVSYHYDLSNEFFSLWLDSRMVYSCAYFESPDESLERAQERKLDYICRKLRLEAGERLLDIGCGWGGLVIFAAANYGVEAHGITLSLRQRELASERIRAAGLTDRCRVEVCDYRDLEARGQYDKVASVGMFEHVGNRVLAEYFRRAFALLRPRGTFFNQGLARPSRAPSQRSPSFTDRYSYPDYELAPIHSTLEAAEEAGFEVRDVECLREQDALTMRKAARRLEASRDAAVKATDEATYRIFRLFLWGLAYECERGYVTLYHSLFVKPERGKSSLPLTRADWYRSSEASPRTHEADLAPTVSTR